MTPTYIDNQTLAGVVIALDLNKPDQWPSWVTQTALSSTCVLSSIENVRVSPPARHDLRTVVAYSGVPGHYGIIGDALSSCIQSYNPDQTLTKSAADTVSAWAYRNTKVVTTAFDDIKKDENYEPWLDYEIRKGWPTTTILLNGLVDEHFITSISKMTGLPRNDLVMVLNSSRDQNNIRKWASPSYVGQDKELAKTLFTIGTLIRGRYHDRVAELFGSSIIHHPMRKGLLKRLPGASQSSFGASNTLEFLAKIIIAGSMRQRTAPERIRVWADNVAMVRKATLHTRAVTIPPDDVADDRALHLAAKAAQECGIRVHAKTLDQIIYHALGVGLGGATSFGLDPWLFPLGYFGSSVLTNAVKAGTDKLARSEFRLSRIAQAIPGRLRRL